MLVHFQLRDLQEKSPNNIDLSISPPLPPNTLFAADEALRGVLEKKKKK
jgi:hypothetical protein